MTSTEVVRFFNLFFKSTLSELNSITQDQIQNIQLESKSVFSSEEILEILQNFGTEIQNLVQVDQEKISKLAGSLAVQLVNQAASQGVQIAPKISDLENEARLKLFEKGVENSNQNQFRKVENTNLIDNEKRIGELEGKLLEKDEENKKLNELLQGKVDEAPQYKNLVKMMKKKNEEIDELRDRLGE